jgi:hypothetical protein
LQDNGFRILQGAIMSNPEKFTVETSISATEANAIMQGKGTEVWKIKKGLAQKEDLTWKFPPQLGLLSESLNRAFYAHEFKRSVFSGTSAALLAAAPQVPGQKFTAEWDLTRTPMDIICRSTVYPWATCHPDGLVSIDGVIGCWEAKHTDAISEWNDAEAVVRRNWWQFVHQMMVLGVPWTEVSVIYGNGNTRKVHRVHRDLNEEALLIGALLEFRKSLEGNVPPGDSIAHSGEGVIIKGGDAKWTRAYTEADLPKLPCSNEFPERAAEFIKHEASAGVFDDAKKALKEMLPEDAISLTAHGVAVVRNAKGAVSVSTPKAKRSRANARAA